MAEQVVEYPIELVPDHDAVFMRAHKNHFHRGNLREGVFRAQGGGMSVDWSKYSTASQTQMRARQPLDNAVIELNVGKIRAIPPLDVAHTPQAMNQAHCDVQLPEDGEDLTEIRFRLRDIVKIVIPLEK